MSPLGRLRRPGSPAAVAYARSRMPARGSGWRQARWAVVDLETTGLDPSEHEIVSFAVVPVEGGRILAGDSLYRVVRPARPPTADSIRVHGIRPADLEHAPPMEAVADELLGALSGRLLVAHAAFVEHSFLEPVLRARGLRIRGQIVDTQLLARAWIRELTGERLPRISLDALARRLGLPVERQHHALGDALTTAQAFLALATHLEHAGRLSVRALLAAQAGGA